MSVIVPDCLVLQIVERDNETHEKDTVLYIFYDVRTMQYIIRGKRHDSHRPARDFSFTTKNINTLADFTSQVVDVDNLWTYVLYGYEDLPNDSNIITYDILNSDASSYREICGYNDLEYNRKSLLRMLKIVKSIVNLY